MKIAFSGKMGSGKTTYADYLVDKYGFKKVSFATKVRDITKAIYNIPDEDMYGPNKPRELLQHIGHVMRETMHKNFWVDSLLAQVRGNDHYVVDDMRYYNEYEALGDNGFILIRLRAPERTRRARLGAAFTNPNHPSETDLDYQYLPWAYIINNDVKDEPNLQQNLDTIILQEQSIKRRTIR